MPGRQANLVSPSVERRALRVLARRPTAARDRVMLLLSLRCGLRACEIARLEWSMALNDLGRVGPCLQVVDRIAKKRGGRRIPVPADLAKALRHLRATDRSLGPIIRSARGGPMRPNSVVNWFIALFREIGVHGCSSHSGRRTFITHAARNAHKAGASLRDVQLLAGHRSIEVTQGYIDGDTDAQRRLVRGLYLGAAR